MRSVLWVAVVAAVSASACSKPFHREMLGKSIQEFSDGIKGSPSDKIWVHNMADSECDRGCQAGLLCGGGGGAPALPAMPGGFFGGGGTSYDGLAMEVFSNYLTQKKKGRVVEAHRHNYATELGTETRSKVEVLKEGAKVATTMLSCEDLCILDEAKKRKSDKVLTYAILDMKNDELLIHFRFSDVRTGLVELSRTLKIVGLSVTDVSY